MNASFYYIFSIVMISRLIFQSKDDPISSRNCIKKAIFEIICSLVFVFDLRFTLTWLVIIIVVLNGLTYYIDKKQKGNIFLNRFLVLILYCFALSIFFPEKTSFMKHNQVILTIKDFLEEYNLLFFIIKKISWEYFLVFLFGTLLVANEANHIVRFVLSKLKVEPHLAKETSQSNNTRAEKDSLDLKRGRIIGIIERVLMFYFVIEGNPASIGLILAAKSITRFKELDDKNFAEYVLIGTLLSAFLAIIIGVLVKKALL